jgi:hypothetical protein
MMNKGTYIQVKEGELGPAVSVTRPDYRQHLRDGRITNSMELSLLRCSSIS